VTMSDATTDFEALLGACVAVNDHPLSGENVSVWVDVPGDSTEARESWGRLPSHD